MKVIVYFLVTCFSLILFAQDKDVKYLISDSEYWKIKESRVFIDDDPKKLMSYSREKDEIVVSMPQNVGIKSASQYEDYMLGVNLSEGVSGQLSQLYEGNCTQSDSDAGCWSGDYPSTGVIACFGYGPIGNTTFLSQKDLNNYAVDFHEKNFIPQGLTIDEDGVMIISMYHHPETRDSIIVWYDPVIDKITRVRDVDRTNFVENNYPHVGGIAYYKEPTRGKSFLLVSNELFINIYRYQGAGNNFYLQFHRSVRIFDDYDKYINDYMSVSEGGYLWTGYYGEDAGHPMLNAPFKGFKLVYDEYWEQKDGREIFWYSLNIGNKGDEISNSNEVRVANFDLKYPEKGGQGVYCDGNPEISKRLNCYFVSSYNRAVDYYPDFRGSETSVYKGTLNFKD